MKVILSTHMDLARPVMSIKMDVKERLSIKRKIIKIYG